jgi:hypothetical protein
MQLMQSLSRKTTSISSVQRIRKKLGLKGTRQQGVEVETIVPLIQEIRSRFPTMGARAMVTVLRQDHDIKVPE